MELITGQRIKAADLGIENNLQLKIQIKLSGCDVDISCFGIDEAEKLSDEKYFIFYNQLFTPERAIVKEENADIFTIELDKLPQKIHKLVLTAAIDGNATMNNLGESKLIISSHGEDKAQYCFSGVQFQQEKAIILAELYQSNGQWRISIVGRGFNGGLSALLAHFGGEEIKEEPVQVQPQTPTKQTPTPVSLAKTEKVQRIVLQKAPHLVDLTKKAIVSLEKKNLINITACVVLVLDNSGSMDQQYKKGRVQRLLDKVLPLALIFDDDGCLDSWTFAKTYRQLSNVTVDNIKNYIETADDGWRKWKVGDINNEPAVMEALYLKYKDSKLPVYIIFVSDGGVSQNRKIKEIIKKAAYAPIFWQFMGIGGCFYGALEKLDEMTGRYVDNAGFFALDDIDSISDEALYDRMMGEFPKWLQVIKSKGML